ncbi:shufflon system plasmid conjugative transfer pilus tip adhesin PilV [Pectobacterium carotovorum]|uniref:shufflon system plasmid conjugative transfer pilus tip adhesin PilV n=1 Tax=Pectobacterium carotovorum TaxID=554 RepID=UPI0029DB2714|nr:shufflon system plasmid conjugative transfer pilus tip adhesin PilV [Pectobacterium carotovorum]MDX6917810.1 shufflon system plasmid conjugative transfer pilus tip adhesin PilV [Pectobacterium carotovorum]
MKKKIHRGMVSIEISVALAIIMIAGIYGMSRYSQYMTELEWSVEARRMDAVTAAAKSYIRDNRETLQSQVSNSGNVKITGAQLQQAGYLPPGFTLSNTSAQTFQIAIVRNPSDNTKLVGFILTQGGKAISYKGLRYIAQSIHGAGGYIQTANQAEGAYGSWKMNLSSYGLSGESGRLAVWLSSDVIGADDQESDRLYRYALASRPELNRMHTAIDMNSNNLNNVGTVNAKTGAFTENITAKNGTITETLNANNGIFSEGVTADSDIRSTDGWLITQNSKGWMNSTHGGGWFMSDDDWMRSLNNKNIYTGGQVRAGSLTSDGRLTIGEYSLHQKVEVAGTVCSQNGLQARDATGAALFCQSGAWGNTSESGGHYTLAVATNNMITSIGSINPGIIEYYELRSCLIGNPKISSRCGCPESYQRTIMGEFSTSDRNDNKQFFTSVACLRR